MVRAGFGDVVEAEPVRLDEPPPVRQIMALEAVVQGVAAQRLVAEAHEHVDEPDDKRAGHDDTERDRKTAQ